MEQQLRSAGENQRVGGDLEGRGVVSLGGDFAAEQHMRLVQPAERAHALQQVIGHAVHHLPDGSIHIGMQSAEIGHAGGGAHAAEETIGFDQQGRLPGFGRRRGSSDAGRAAAKHHNVVAAPDRRLAAGFGQGHEWRRCLHRRLCPVGPCSEAPMLG